MNTETLQINIAQRVLAMTDNKLLQKIRDLIVREDILAYDSLGKPLTEKEYIKQLDEVITEMESGIDEGLTSDEVFKNISNAHHLE
ncbi:hypothetical protein [Chryseobacterium koreense]|uniref:Uncharacterized protein n=1 Tax=Chryseobacterium koreense CCUG 49689 TaxID=1304281 RepID=A0A0J7IYQ5_9FLAO|nr:hypothetical protein [Chryseobacterium koreense]KMQ70944.1 hypothetical protein ACM44_10040 [Chryseobacterium koreense CCUG 49689]MBB5332391.1 tRNA A37 N6-isopentenylltransferase MiaA [Chryseobacterium koreense]